MVATPVYQAAYSGLLKVFLDLLPQFAFRGKAVLPIVTGGSPAHVLAVDYALRPVLANLGAAHIGQGWFVPSSHISGVADGGVLIEPASLAPVAQVTDEFLATVQRQRRRRRCPARVDARRGARVSPIAGNPDLQVHRVTVGDPRLQPLLADLIVEYGTRYGRPSPNTQLTEVPASDFVEPYGAFLILKEDGVTVAGGAIRRYDPQTAEVKRVWTSHRHRRRGLARRVMAELEAAAAELGYQRIHLTTGPRQPEARNLYLAAGYTPRFDATADPETIGPLAFGKELCRRRACGLGAAAGRTSRRRTPAGLGRPRRRPARWRSTGNGAAENRPAGPIPCDRASMIAGMCTPSWSTADPDEHPGASSAAGRAPWGCSSGWRQRRRTAGARICTSTSIDPYPAGGGRIWRTAQSELLWMNSMARDVTIFTDESVTCEGPIVPGPALDEWVDGQGREILRRRRVGRPGRRVATGRFRQQADPVALPAVGARPGGPVAPRRVAGR